MSLKKSGLSFSDSCYGNRMEKGDQIEVDVEKVVFPGKGLARLDGYVVFVPGVIEGERIRARITRSKKKYAEAVLEEVLKPSPARSEPVCPINDKCPGCCYQHTSYEREIDIKGKQFVNFLEHEAGLNVPEGIDAVQSPSCTGYRNRITLHIAEGSNGTCLGYIGYDKQSVVEVQSCPLALPEINDFMASLLSDADFMSSLPRDGTVMLRHSPVSGTYYLVKEKKRQSVVRAGISRKYIEEDTVMGPIKAPLKGFFQVNVSVLNMLLECVAGIVRDIEPASFVDVYCGSGLFSIAAASAGVANVLGIEADTSLVKAAELNCREKGLDNVTFLADSAGNVLGNALDCVDSSGTMVLVDPTRHGLERPVRDALISSRPKWVMYISCAPDKLARDLKPLAEAGYRIEKARLFDMFPRTPYFESATLLQLEG